MYGEKSYPFRVERSTEFKENLQAAQLISPQLKVPIIRVSSNLRTNLDAAKRRLEVNEPNLLKGSQVIDLHQHINVRLSSVSKLDDSLDPKMTFEKPVAFNGIWSADLAIQPAITPDEIGEGAYRNLNTKFWLGVLVCEVLAEGMENDYALEQLEAVSAAQNRSNTRWFRRPEPIRRLPVRDYIASQKLDQSQDLGLDYPILSQEYILD